MAGRGKGMKVLGEYRPGILYNRSISESEVSSRENFEDDNFKENNKDYQLEKPKFDRFLSLVENCSHTSPYKSSISAESVEEVFEPGFNLNNAGFGNQQKPIFDSPEISHPHREVRATQNNVVTNHNDDHTNTNNNRTASYYNSENTSSGPLKEKEHAQETCLKLNIGEDIVTISSTNKYLLMNMTNAVIDHVYKHPNYEKHSLNLLTQRQYETNENDPFKIDLSGMMWNNQTKEKLLAAISTNNDNDTVNHSAYNSNVTSTPTNPSIIKDPFYLSRAKLIRNALTPIKKLKLSTRHDSNESDVTCLEQSIAPTTDNSSFNKRNYSKTYEYIREFYFFLSQSEFSRKIPNNWFDLSIKYPDVCLSNVDEYFEVKYYDYKNIFSMGVISQIFKKNT